MSVLPATPYTLPAPVRRELALALAAAEERLVRVQAHAAARFVLTTRGDLPLERAVDIFFRLIGVAGAERRAVAVRALALLRRALPREGHRVHAAATLERWPERLARRLRGRREAELRIRIESNAARARRAVRRAHLQNVTEVAGALGNALGRPQAVQLYLEHLRVGRGWAETIFHDAVTPPAA